MKTIHEVPRKAIRKDNKIKDFFIFIMLYAFALISWYLIFVEGFLEFWFSLSVSFWILGTLANQYYGLPITKEDISFKAFATATASAAVLYACSYLGMSLIQSFLPTLAESDSALFTNIEHQFNMLADFKKDESIWLISFVILFIAGPYEEIFWRGYVQNLFSKRFSPILGIVLSTLFYASIQIATGNIILILAALFVGAFFSSLYYYTKNLFTCIIAHSLWTYTAYILFPLI